MEKIIEAYHTMEEFKGLLSQQVSMAYFGEYGKYKPEDIESYELIKRDDDTYDVSVEVQVSYSNCCGAEYEYFTFPLASIDESAKKAWEIKKAEMIRKEEERKKKLLEAEERQRIELERKERQEYERLKAKYGN